MSNFKTNWKMFWRIVWECFKKSLTPGAMFFAASCVNFILTNKLKTVSATVGWAIVCLVAALVYDGFLMWLAGGDHYEMLVSGNMKRRSAMQLGSELNITSYKFEKEYRPWKGFVIGAFMALPLIIGSIIFGCNQEAVGSDDVSQAFAVLILIVDLFAGWGLLPVQVANLNGSSISYFLVMPLAVLPILVTGGMYIAGAYGRRNKALRKQEIAARAAAAEANKPKKINYGGLPGTKPRKKK
jgi:hypothetical protein